MFSPTTTLGNKIFNPQVQGISNQLIATELKQIINKTHYFNDV